MPPSMTERYKDFYVELLHLEVSTLTVLQLGSFRERFFLWFCLLNLALYVAPSLVLSSGIR